MKTIPLMQLADEKLVAFCQREYADYHALLARVLKEVIPRPPVAVECDGSSTLFAQVAAGRGVAILSQVFGKIVGTRLRLRPLTPAPAPQEVGIVRAFKGDVTPAGEKFCDHLREAAKALMG